LEKKFSEKKEKIRQLNDLLDKKDEEKNKKIKEYKD